MPDADEGTVDHRPQRFQIIRLGKVDRQLGRRAVGQAYVAIVLEKLLNDVGDVGVRTLLDAEDPDVPRDVLEDVVPNSFRQAVPDNHVAEGLAPEVRRTRRVDDGEHVRLGGQIVHGLADFLQLAFERLPVRVMCLVGEDRQMR